MSGPPTISVPDLIHAQESRNSSPKAHTSRTVTAGSPTNELPPTEPGNDSKSAWYNPIPRLRQSLAYLHQPGTKKNTKKKDKKNKNNKTGAERRRRRRKQKHAREQQEQKQSPQISSASSSLTHALAQARLTPAISPFPPPPQQEEEETNFAFPFPIPQTPSTASNPILNLPPRIPKDTFSSPPHPHHHHHHQDVTGQPHNQQHTPPSPPPRCEQDYILHWLSLPSTRAAIARARREQAIADSLPSRYEARFDSVECELNQNARDIFDVSRVVEEGGGGGEGGTWFRNPFLEGREVGGEEEEGKGKDADDGVSPWSARGEFEEGDERGSELDFGAGSELHTRDGGSDIESTSDSATVRGTKKRAWSEGDDEAAVVTPAPSQYTHTFLPVYAAPVANTPVSTANGSIKRFKTV